jgi:hypothetical protein
MSTSSRLPWLACLGIFCGIALVSLPLAEGFFRLIGDEPSVDLQGLYVSFAGDNYKLGPNVETSASLASGLVSVHTDALGLRCDGKRERGLKRGAVVDYLVIGDSQGFGNGLNFEDTIAGRFANLAANARVTVANASVGGHSLASQLEVARWLVDTQDVQVRNFVLLFSPALIENSDRLNHVAVGPDGRIYGAPPTLRMQAVLWLRTNSVTYSRLRDATRNLGIGAEPAKGSPTVFEFYREDQGEASSARLSTAISDFQQFALARGAKVHAVYIPLTVEADFSTVQGAAKAQGLTLNPDLPKARCEQVVRKLGIPLHNLKPVAERVHAEGHVLTVKADFHYSAALSRECGEALWEIFGKGSRSSATAAGREAKTL